MTPIAGSDLVVLPSEFWIVGHGVDSCLYHAKVRLSLIIIPALRSVFPDVVEIRACQRG